MQIKKFHKFLKHPKKPSPLDEALTNFMKANQTSFEEIGKNQEVMFKTQMEMTKNQ